MSPLPHSNASNELPEWIDDLRLWYALDALPNCQVQTGPPDSRSSQDLTLNPNLWEELNIWWPAGARLRLPTATEFGPVWFENCFSPVSRVSQKAKPEAARPKLTSQSSLGESLRPSYPDDKSKLETETPSPSDPFEMLVNCAIDQTGLDLRTGSVVNSARFQKWSQEYSGTSKSIPHETNASLMELFRKARMAVEKWIDQDINRALIARGDLREILSNPGVFTLFHNYADFGPLFLNKLAKHFLLLIEDRKWFYSLEASEMGGNL